MAAAEQREARNEARHRRKAIEEVILRPEHDGRTEDDRIRSRFEHGSFAGSLGARVGRGRVRVGTDGGDMDDTLGPSAAGGFRHGAGSEIM